MAMDLLDQLADMRERIQAIAEVLEPPDLEELFGRLIAPQLAALAEWSDERLFGVLLGLQRATQVIAAEVTRREAASKSSACPRQTRNKKRGRA